MATKPKSRKAGAREMAKEERQRKVAEMILQAMSLRQISNVLGVSHETVRQDRDAALAELRKDKLNDIEAYREIQRVRREEVINTHRPVALDPDDPKCHASAGIVHQYETALSKLMGTDMPMQTETKTEITGDYNGPSVIITMAEADNEGEEEDGNDDSAS